MEQHSTSPPEGSHSSHHTSFNTPTTMTSSVAISSQAITTSTSSGLTTTANTDYSSSSCGSHNFRGSVPSTGFNLPQAYSWPEAAFGSMPLTSATYMASSAILTNATQAVNTMYRQPKIAAFCRDNPSIWFMQAEIALRNAGITASSTKADCITENLDHEALQVICDIISGEPRPADIFERVKKRLIDTYDIPVETRLRQLIKGQVSTLGKPSLILNRLRGLNTGANDDVLRSVFLQQLSPHCRAALVISEIADLNKLAQLADKVDEATKANHTLSASTSINALRSDNQHTASPTSTDDKILEALTEGQYRALTPENRKRAFAGTTSSSARKRATASTLAIGNAHPARTTRSLILTTRSRTNRPTLQPLRETRSNCCCGG